MDADRDMGAITPARTLSDEEVGVSDSEADRIALVSDEAVSKRLERGEVEGGS